MEPATIVVLAVFISLVVFWGSQFIALMLMSDADFPGRYDKALWAITFVLLSLVAPFVFVFWKQAYAETLDRARRKREQMQ